MSGNGRRHHNNKGAFKNDRNRGAKSDSFSATTKGRQGRDSKRPRQYDKDLSATVDSVVEDEVLIDESNTPFRQLVGGLLARDQLSERERKAMKQVEKEIVDGMEDDDEFEEGENDDDDEYDDQEQEQDEDDDEALDDEIEEDQEDLDDEEEDLDKEEDGDEDLDEEENLDDEEGEEGDAVEEAIEDAEDDDDESQIIDESDEEENSINGIDARHAELSPSDPFLHRLDDRNKKIKQRQSINLTFEGRTSFRNNQNKNKNEEEMPLETSLLALSGNVIVTDDFSQSNENDSSSKSKKKKDSAKATETSLLKRTHVHPRLLDAWKRYRSRDKDNRGETLSEIQQTLLPFVSSSYADLGFFARNLTNAVDLRELYTLHLLNHVFKARDLVESHDSFINQRTREARATGKPAEFTEEEEQAQRDQGFCRPRVLVVLPFKSSAFKFIKLLLELFPPKTRVRNYERFLEEFGPLPEEDDDEHEQEWRLHQVEKKYSASYKEIDFVTGKHPALFSVDEQQEKKKKKKKDKSDKTSYIKSTKPVEWHSVFDENSEEDFRIGIALNSAKSVKLFSSFYQSDIIVASPLGLRLATKQAMEADVHDEDDPTASGTLSLDAVQDEENEDLKIEGDKNKKKRTRSKAELEVEKEDTDFLSSIEVLVIDECDAFHMQNWQHLEDICVGINRRPKELREEMDFSRVYERLLDSKARLFRQTLLFSSFPDAMVNALISRGGLEKEGLFLSPSGSIRVRAKFYPGVASLAPTKLVQRFKRVDDDQMKRCDYFVSKVIPKLCRADYGAGILLFVPSYFDFVRIKNALRKEQKQVEREMRAAGLLEDSDDEEEEELDEDGKPKKVYGKRHKKKKAQKTFFETCCEYTSPTNVTRARAKFYYGNTKMLVMTERYYYYFRSRTRGVKRVVFYAPPQHPNFYLEVLDWVAQPSEAESVCFFSKLDALELERIVGSKRAKKAISGELVVAKTNKSQQQQDAFSIICQDEDEPAQDADE